MFRLKKMGAIERILESLKNKLMIEEKSKTHIGGIITRDFNITEKGLKKIELFNLQQSQTRP